MTQVKALQLSYLKREPEFVEILVRGVFWPLWPLRGKIWVTAEQVRLKLPFSKTLEVLPRERIDHLLLDKLGAGVFVMLALKDQPAPSDAEPAVEEVAPADPAPQDEAPVPVAKPVRPVVKSAAKAPVVEPEKPALEKRYLGFFGDPEEARLLGELMSLWGYGLVSWLGNWRKT